ncbi:MAG: hypothetical protein AAGJ73_07710 [Pseudomonadota bacterium]
MPGETSLSVMLERSQREKVVSFWREFRERPAVRRTLSIIQYSLLAAIVVYLLYRFSQVGWGEVIGALPTSPWFYLFFALRFLTLPVSELAIYEMIWRVPLWRYFPVFVRKRVYNFAVMGYSGEAFLTLWARRTLPLSTPTVVVGVKDNNLLSALASNLSTVIVIVIVAALGTLSESLRSLPPGTAFLFAAAFTTALTLSIAVLLFRNKLIALSSRKMAALMGVHVSRTFLILLLHAGMYAAALPEAPISAWLMFLALQLVLSRIPFIPNQDLVFLGAALSLSSIVGASEAAVAGMLLAEAGLSQLVNFSLFFATAYLAQHDKTASTGARGT